MWAGDVENDDASFVPVDGHTLSADDSRSSLTKGNVRNFHLLVTSQNLDGLAASASSKVRSGLLGEESPEVGAAGGAKAQPSWRA